MEPDNKMTSPEQSLLVKMIQEALTCALDEREKAKKQVIECEKRIFNLEKNLDALSK